VGIRYLIYWYLVVALVMALLLTSKQTAATHLQMLQFRKHLII